MRKTHLLALALVAAGAVAAFGASEETHAAASPAVKTPSEPAGALPPGHPAIGETPEEARVEGTIAEVVDVERYSYVRLSGPGGDTWAAVPRRALAVGRRVRVKDALAMHDFKSPSLGRSFPLVYFGTLEDAAAP